MDDCTSLPSIRTHENVIDYELLRYHRYGESKYHFLGKVYELAEFVSPLRNSWSICVQLSTRRMGEFRLAAGDSAELTAALHPNCEVL